jgi:hypothetical protein
MLWCHDGKPEMAWLLPIHLVLGNLFFEAQEDLPKKYCRQWQDHILFVVVNQG